jgi:S1-C subfamily serine protease
MNRRPYAGSWEYLLDDAIYTAPVHGEFGGAALVGADGSLLGIGSLMVDVAEAGHTPFPGNVFVPINQLKPILGDLVRHGRASGRTNPWLGVYTGEQAGRVFIQRVSDGGPAERAGLRSGDIIVGVAGRRVADTESFLRQVWAGGRAGDPISLDILRPERGTLDINRVLVPSISRYDWLRLGPAR